MAFIEVKGITKKFGGLTAVDNVDFEIEQGKITGGGLNDLIILSLICHFAV